MILYFISRLIIIGPETNYEYMLKNIDFSGANHFFGSVILPIIYMIIYCQPEKKKQNINETKEESQPFRDESILQSVFCLIFINYLIGFVYSILVLFFDFEDTKFICGFNVTINAFVVFLINYYCLNITKIQIDFDFLFPQTILISLYFIIIDNMIYLIKLLFNDIYNLFLFQFIIGSIPAFLFLITSLILGIGAAFKKCCCDIKKNNTLEN